MKKKKHCTLKREYIRLLKLYNYPIPCKDMPEMLGIDIHKFYTWQKNINKELGMPSIAHSVAYCKDEGWI